jgi:hypothetical protein
MRSHDAISSTCAGRRAHGRIAAGAIIATLLLAACGGDSDSGGSEAQAGDPLPAADSGAESTAEAAVETPVAVGAGYVDLVGPDVIAASEIDTNLLPSVVVDDLTNDRKVNFRNLVPQEKPVLLWMWAPH